jgi:cysteine desulfurase/selenocysteine lyase
VIKAIGGFYSKEYATVHRAIYDLAAQATTRYQGVRQKVQSFLNAAHIEEIIFTKGTTEAINLVAHSFGEAFLKENDEVILTQMEHHSNIVPWQLLAQRKGIKIKVIPINQRGELILEEYERLLSEKTKLVSVTHISNSLGTLNPIEQIIRLAHQKGAKVLIDGAQSAGHLEVDVQALDADFYVFSGHKIYGPTGIGILYGKKELLEKMPPYQGGGDMIEKVTFETTTFQRPPLKFEAGTPLIAEVIGLGAAISYIENIGRKNIISMEKQLYDYAMSKLQDIPGISFLGTAAQKGPIISFVIKGVHHLDIGTMLNLRGIAVRTGHLCAQPTMQHFQTPGMIRASFAIYNVFEEIDLFASALKEILPMLNSSFSESA